MDSSFQRDAQTQACMRSTCEFELQICKSNLDCKAQGEPQLYPRLLIRSNVIQKKVLAVRHDI